MTRFARRLAFPALLALLPACELGKSGSSGTTVSGAAVKGPIQGATVEVLALTPTAGLGAVLGSGTTDAAGNFQVAIGSAAGPVAVRVTGNATATYKNEATGAAAAFTAGDSLLAFLPTPVGAVAANVTPLTHFAALRIQQLAPASALPLDTLIAQVNASVAGQFGIASVTAVAPADLTDATPDAAGTDATNYALVLAGYAREALAAGVTPTVFAGAVAQDYRSDGLFNGQLAGGAPVPLGAGTLSTTASTSGLTTGIANFLASPQNTSGVTAAAETTFTAPLSGTTLPSAPGGLLATAGNGSVTLTWNSVPGATSYTIYYASATGVTKTNYNTLPDGTRLAGVSSPYTRAGLADGKTWFFVVTASDTAGEGPVSAEASTTLPDITPPTVTITTPTTAATFNTAATTLTVAGAASDNVGITSVAWANSTGGAGAATGTTSWSASIALQQGSNVITVTAVDAVGNPGSASITVTYAPVPPPTITSISPSSGPQFGRIPITITGTNFQSGAVAMFASSKAFVFTEQVTVVSATTIQTYAPSGGLDPGASDEPAKVIVINPDKQSNATPGTFTYLSRPELPPKACLIIDPNVLLSFIDVPQNYGNAAGGDTRWIFGTNFNANATVGIGGTPVAVTGAFFPYRNAQFSTVFHALQVVTPTGTAGAADVIVTNPDGQSVTLKNGFVYVAPPRPFIAIVTVNDLDGCSNGQTLGDGVLYVPPSGFSIDIRFDDVGPNRGIDTNSLTVTSTVPLGGVPVGGNLISKFSFVTVQGYPYPTRATWSVSSVDAFPQGTVTLTSTIRNGAGTTSLPMSYTFKVQPFTTLSNHPLGKPQAWYLNFNYAPDLVAYGLCTNSIPTTPPEQFVKSTLDDYVLKMTRENYHLDPVTGAPTGDPDKQIANLSILPGPAPAGFSPNGTFSIYTIGGGPPGGVVGADALGLAPGDFICGNNSSQEDFGATTTYSCSLLGSPFSKSLGPPLGTFLIKADGTAQYGQEPQFASFLVPPNGIPVGSHPDDAFVLSPSFSRTNPTNTASQNARWDDVIGDPIINGNLTGGAVWSLARQLAAVNAQEIGHAMGLLANGPLPYGLLGGTNMQGAHLDESIDMTLLGIRIKFINLTTYNGSFQDLADPNTQVGPADIELRYLQGRIVRKNPFE